ncbi:hypothetical protein I5L10_16465 [Serratia marcescens]|nr:hypothetical protein [Serratia marcescens]MBH2692678.1 hypothetical protein [Serratia marcescens]MBH3048048.1 hypothetical protein [Serratia marcescens]MBH3224454.1 hypothetical protein [Serratia marcescens]
MDSTLLGALIGAGAAIVGSIVTAIATYFVNKKIESNKLITTKKEELYNACDELSFCILVCNIAVSAGKFESEKVESALNRIMPLQIKIRMIIDIYLKNLKPLKDSVDSAMEKFAKDCLKPSGEASFSNNNYTPIGTEHGEEALKVVMILKNKLK